MLRRRRSRRPREATRSVTPEPAREPVVTSAALEGTLQARLGVLERELSATTGDVSLCAISRSAGSVPAVKHLEGRLAALMELRRAGREDGPHPGTLETLLATWRRGLEEVRAREAGPDWVAYRAGGVDELEELAHRLTDPPG
ncbi:MAG: hypothetical protein ACLFS9_03220 [Nitriliruptoraceae bacterium]